MLAKINFDKLNGVWDVLKEDGTKTWFYTKDEASLFRDKLNRPKYEFIISNNRRINVRLERNGNGYGQGVNNLIKWNEQRPGKMVAVINVYILDGIVNTPIGGIESWNIDESYKTKRIAFKTYAQFVKITRDVEIKLLSYFTTQKETVSS